MNDICQLIIGILCVFGVVGIILIGWWLIDVIFDLTTSFEYIKKQKRNHKDFGESETEEDKKKID